MHALANILKYFILKEASIEQLIKYFQREKVNVKKFYLKNVPITNNFSFEIRFL